MATEAAVNPAKGALWTLREAHGINAAGMITGHGYYTGPGGGGTASISGDRAFVLDASSLVGVPEPTGVTLLAACALALLRGAGTRRT
jgi:hypothetical protein